jgi:DNA-binding helix-hairpin-helix protein with protein kinase domain
MTIRFNISLPYTWAKHRPMKWFSTYVHRDVGEFKAFEWQTDYFGWSNLFGLGLDLIPTGSDHAEVGFSLTILGFMVEAKIYDSRHWDSENNTWEAYDEEAQQRRMAREDRQQAAQLELAYQLVKDDENRQTRKSVEEFLESPQGQALIDRKAKEKLDNARQSKEAKRTRGEAYKAANLAKGNDSV